MVQEMAEAGHDVAIFFYNPNIHPKQEYEIRKDENKRSAPACARPPARPPASAQLRALASLEEVTDPPPPGHVLTCRYAKDLGIPFIDADYDTEAWFERAKGMEFDPERGARCSMCFDMRMERTALHAFEHGFDCFTTTNATSRWKDQKQVNASGLKAAARYGFRPYYWVYDWQTDAMTRRKYEINAQQRFYKQEYCGCSYSLRDNNAYRRQQGQPPVRIGGDEAGVGSRYYTDPDVDEAEESQEEVDAFFRSAEGHFDNSAVLRGRRRTESSEEAVQSNPDANNW